MRQPKLKWAGNIRAQEEANSCFHKSKKQKTKPAAKRIDYYQYIQSKKWKKKRKRALNYYKKCQMCGSTMDLRVHHKHYNSLGKEKIKDLQVLCKNCHADLHNKLTDLDKEYDKLVQSFI